MAAEAEKIKAGPGWRNCFSFFPLLLRGVGFRVYGFRVRGLGFRGLGV